MYTLLLLFSYFHAIHISKTEINYDQAGKSLQITTHIFIDDLERAIQASGGPKLNIGSKSELANSDEEVEKYLAKRFSLQTPGGKLKPVWLGKELSEDYLAVWCYLEVENIPQVTELTIQNDVLLDLYDDQSNIIETRKNNKPNSAKIIGKRGEKLVFNFR
ncbi:MAG: hypothetical protein KDC49_23140 [Saprospiraceae bacterium]|nr:hypothetical protein [Saprospiraceae bacterium]